MTAMTRASMLGIRTAWCIAGPKADPTAESTVSRSDAGAEPRRPPPVTAAAILPAVGAGTPREMRAPGRLVARPLVAAVAVHRAGMSTSLPLGWPWPSRVWAWAASVRG
jgi:hypothetical protein